MKTNVGIAGFVLGFLTLGVPTLVAQTEEPERLVLTFWQVKVRPSMAASCGTLVWGRHTSREAEVEATKKPAPKPDPKPEPEPKPEPKPEPEPETTRGSGLDNDIQTDEVILTKADYQSRKGPQKMGRTEVSRPAVARELSSRTGPGVVDPLSPDGGTTSRDPGVVDPEGIR